MARAVSVLLMLFALHGGAKAAEDGGAGPPSQGPPTAEQDTRININEAGVDALVQLPGIGPSRAQAIVVPKRTGAMSAVKNGARVLMTQSGGILGIASLIVVYSVAF